MYHGKKQLTVRIMFDTFFFTKINDIYPFNLIEYIDTIQIQSS